MKALDPRTGRYTAIPKEPLVERVTLVGEPPAPRRLSAWDMITERPAPEMRSEMKPDSWRFWKMVEPYVLLGWIALVALICAGIAGVVCLWMGWVT